MKVVIVGGGYAGVSAALRLARHRVGDMHIVLVNDRPAFIERIRLHQRATGQRVHSYSLANMLASTCVDLKIGEMQALDCRRQLIAVNDVELDWDVLILATGMRIDISSVPGAAE